MKFSYSYDIGSRLEELVVDNFYNAWQARTLKYVAEEPEQFVIFEYYNTICIAQCENPYAEDTQNMGFKFWCVSRSLQYNEIFYGKSDNINLIGFVNFLKDFLKDIDRLSFVKRILCDWNFSYSQDEFVGIDIEWTNNVLYILHVRWFRNTYKIGINFPLRLEPDKLLSLEFKELGTFEDDFSLHEKVRAAVKQAAEAELVNRDYLLTNGYL